MPWEVLFHQEYLPEFSETSDEVQDEVLALVELLQEFGPHLKRPHCDTLKGSKHANMKELRFSVSDGVWRVAFAFDTQRAAILLVGGNKQGVASQRFYRNLIRIADQRFSDHLDNEGD